MSQSRWYSTFGEKRKLQTPPADNEEVSEFIELSLEAETDWLATPVSDEDRIVAPVCDGARLNSNEELRVKSLVVCAAVQVGKVVSELACCVASKEFGYP